MSSRGVLYNRPFIGRGRLLLEGPRERPDHRSDEGPCVNESGKVRGRDGRG